MLTRRALALAGLAGPWSAAAGASASATGDLRRLDFPRDFGAHQGTAIEWWYLTGALAAGARSWGFQITFFRAATGLIGSGTSRFGAAQLVFAHAALTDVAGGRLLHDQRIARTGFGIAAAADDDTHLRLRDWRLDRAGGAGPSRYVAQAASETAGFAFDLLLDASQPVLVQGIDGTSKKGPDDAQSSRYYSEPQLATSGTVRIGAMPAVAVVGRAWLDHEWSDSLLDPEAVGWDWIGMNLDDGSALTAFRLRRADGTTLWAGGSYRPAFGQTRDFAATEVSFVAGRTWRSPASKAVYPVEWTVTTPAGRYVVVAVQDDQELDSRASTGSIYWEGLSRIHRDAAAGPGGSLDAGAARRPAVGQGYLEMTGYAGRLRL